MNAVRMVSPGFTKWHKALDHALWMNSITGLKYQVLGSRHHGTVRWDIYTAGDVKKHHQLIKPPQRETE